VRLAFVEKVAKIPKSTAVNQINVTESLVFEPESTQPWN